MINIKMYPAENGDSFLISFGKENRKHILIDCGYAETYHKYLKKDLLEIKEKGEKINLFIVTHIDEDHILGAIEFLEDNNNSRFIEVEEIWYNCYRHLQFEKKQGVLSEKEKRILRREIDLGESYVKRESIGGISKSEISVKQGSTLGALILSGGYKWNDSFEGKAVSRDNLEKINFGDINITILSPNEEKLEKLKEKWLKELMGKKWNFNITEDNLFDDAFEFMMLMQKELQIEKTEVSLKEKNITDSIEKLIKEKINLDNSSTNGSSIAICIGYQKRNLLFLGDGHPDILESSIYNLGIEKFDSIKVPHHGSKKNMTLDLSRVLKSDKFLISTNGKNHSHPDLETIAKLIYMHKDMKNFYFNYETEASKWICVEEMKKRFNLEVFIGNGNSPINIVID
ncbi:beta-lactamase superfamily II metal-dependent hydrolase [Sporosarcina luteola]|nr:beta-lactamase superfamily II metal-dependent hydrolase [Sporosarcina luteola]